MTSAPATPPSSLPSPLVLSDGWDPACELRGDRWLADSKEVKDYIRIENEREEVIIKYAGMQIKLRDQSISVIQRGTSTIHTFTRSFTSEARPEYKFQAVIGSSSDTAHLAETATIKTFHSVPYEYNDAFFDQASLTGATAAEDFAECTSNDLCNACLWYEVPTHSVIKTVTIATTVVGFLDFHVPAWFEACHPQEVAKLRTIAEKAASNTLARKWKRLAQSNKQTAESDKKAILTE